MYSKANVLLGLVSLLGLAAAAPASAADFDYISVGAESRTATVQLDGVQDHDVYQDVYINKTCTRDVFSHYENYCYDEASPVCRTDASGQRECTTVTRRECESRAVYSTETYDCSYWTQVWVGKQIDYYVNATVSVTIEMPEGAQPNERIQARIDNSSGAVYFSAQNTSKSFLIFVDKHTDTEITAPMQKKVTVQATIRLIPATQIREAFQSGIENAQLTEGRLSFEMKDHLFADQLDLELKLMRTRTLWFSKKLMNGKVTDEALILRRENGRAFYSVDIHSLPLKEPLEKGRKYKFTLNVSLSSEAVRDCINTSDLGTVELEVTQKKVKI